MPSALYPKLGWGLGLRNTYFSHILTHKPAVDWFEIITENFISLSGRPAAHLEQLRADYPLVAHGVSLSIAGTDPLDFQFLSKLKQLVKRYEISWVSDHLCWMHHDDIYLHDLMPLPFTKEALTHVVSRVRQVQDYLGERLVLENISSYLTFSQNTMTEWEFLSEVARQADCLILLDINNVYVNAVNHQFDPFVFLDAMPAERVQQFHLAGHTRDDHFCIDTHDHKITASVWELYAYAIKRFQRASTLIEWDAKLPEFNVLLDELTKAKHMAEKITCRT